MLIALGAAGVTLAVVLGVIGIPAVDACSGDPRGVVTCIRDMADRKFDLPGTVPGQAATPAPVVRHTEAPAPSVTVELPRVATIEPSASVSAAMPEATSQPPTLKSQPDEQPSPVAAASTDSAPAVPSRPAPPTVTVEVATVPEPAAVPSTAPSVPAAVMALLPAPQTPAAPQLAAAEPPPPAPDPGPALDPFLGPAPGSIPPGLDVANAEPVQLQSEIAPTVAAPLVLAPTIDAIELDGVASFVSGTGPAGALMRLYADGELIGESPVAEGRWLVEGQNLLDSRRSELRVEAIEPETGKLLGFAAITVEIELPDDRTPPDERPAETPDLGSGVAPKDGADPAANPLASAPAIAPAPPVSPAAEMSADVATVSEAPMAAEPIPPALEAAPQHPAEPDPIVILDPLPELAAVIPRRQSASVDILGGSELEPTVLPPVDAITHGPATITLDPPDAPALVAEFSVPDPQPPGQPVTVLRLLPFGDPDEGRYNVGKAIIRHGDTLWSLARRYYGHGIHYRTIFHANRDLIRRPSRIFPGQIFDLPLVTDD